MWCVVLVMWLWVLWRWLGMVLCMCCVKVGKLLSVWWSGFFIRMIWVSWLERVKGMIDCVFCVCGWWYVCGVWLFIDCWLSVYWLWCVGVVFSVYCVCGVMIVLVCVWSICCMWWVSNCDDWNFVVVVCGVVWVSRVWLLLLVWWLVLSCWLWVLFRCCLCVFWNVRLKWCVCCFGMEWCGMWFVWVWMLCGLLCVSVCVDCCWLWCWSLLWSWFFLSIDRLLVLWFFWVCWVGLLEFVGGFLCWGCFVGLW